MNQLHSNEQLLKRYQTSDPEAFEEFYLRNKKIVFNFLLARLGNAQDAEEVFQESFLRIHRQILKYDARKSALSWTFSIARNAAIDLLRKKRVRQGVVNKVNLDNLKSEGFRIDLAIEARQELGRLLVDLNEQEQKIITDKLIEQKSYSEIAIELGCAEGSARQKVSRLLRKLRLKPSIAKD